MYVDVCRQAECLLDVLFIGDEIVRFANQIGHHRGRWLTPLPKVLTEIQIAGHWNAEAARRACSVDRQSRSRLADSGRDAGYVKPPGARKRARPVDTPWRRQRERAAIAVVHDLRGPLARADLEKVDPHAAVRPHDVRRVDTETAKLIDRCVTKRI